jgi:hypothetical protein
VPANAPDSDDEMSLSKVATLAEALAACGFNSP